MKKILPFLILVLMLTSCSQDIRFNDEAVFQGIVNNAEWKGGDAKANRANNVLTISAGTLIDAMQLKIPVPTTIINPKDSRTFKTFELGTSNNKTAFYSLTADGQTSEFQTAIGVGDGEIIVKEYDGITTSGTFRFNAKSTDPDSDEIVNVQSGTFYKVPVY